LDDDEHGKREKNREMPLKLEEIWITNYSKKGERETERERKQS